MEEKTGQKWLWRTLDFINPLRDPSLTVAAVLTFIEEAGQHDPWYWYIVIALIKGLQAGIAYQKERALAPQRRDQEEEDYDEAPA